MNIVLPEYIFITGVLGSDYDKVASVIEQSKKFNISDRTEKTNMKGAVFGHGMKYQPVVNKNAIDVAWELGGGCKLVKGHDWAQKLNRIETQMIDSWVIMVYRPDMMAYASWHQDGGLNIKYPNYHWYDDSTGALNDITRLNRLILEYGHKRNVQWEYFSKEWLSNKLGIVIDDVPSFKNMLVSLVKL